MEPSYQAIIHLDFWLLEIIKKEVEVNSKKSRVALYMVWQIESRDP